MLSVEHVTKQYGNFTALEDISLTFTPGVYGLLAPNGAGKTTLIKMLTTLYRQNIVFMIFQEPFSSYTHQTEAGKNCAVLLFYCNF